jgi:glycine/D-amino acid oxidase-like deaminating enzyme
MPSSKIDTVIIGNGVIGYSIAYELAKRARDLRIAVVGPSGRGGAASAAAGAMLNTFGEVTKNTLRSAAGEAKFELCHRALDRWPSWLEELKQASGDPDLDRSLSHGTTVLYNTKSGFLDDKNFKAFQEALVKFAEPHEEIDPEDIVGLRPAPDARPLRAIHVPREGSIDARAVLAGLEAAAAGLNVVTVDREVVEILTQGGKATGVALGDGTTVEADTVILSAGAFTGQLTKIFEPGAVPLMLAGRGIAMLTRRASEPGFEHVVRSPTRAGACGLHVLPMGDGVEYYGATNDVYGQPSHLADFGMSQLLMQFAIDQLDKRLYFADIERWLVGNRPVALDGFPMIGRTSINGLLIVAGTYRDGFHCSPVLAQLVVDDLLGVGSLAAELPHFVPERAPIQIMTPDESAKELVLQAVSGTYEGGVSLPGWHVDSEVLDVHYRTAVERYLSVFDEPTALLPEVFLHVIFDPEFERHPVTEYLRAASARYGN